jgi:transposase-like protein
LAKEFEPPEQTIGNWITQAQLDAGEISDGLTSIENEELRRLRRENRRLKLERHIFQKPRPGSQGRAPRSRTDLPVVRDHQAIFQVAVLRRLLGSLTAVTTPGRTTAIGES